jgi:DNA-binding MarR family transcriptional regulator
MNPGRPAFAFLELWAAARRSVRLVAEELAARGVGDAELACLLHLSAAPDGLTLTGLAEAMGVPFMSASDAVARLERDGDARRGRHPDDARATLVVLTAAGRRRAEAAAKLLDALARKLARDAGLTSAELRALVLEVGAAVGSVG